MRAKWSIRAVLQHEVAKEYFTPPGLVARSSQVYPQHSIRQYPFIHLGEERHFENIGVLHNTPQCLWPVLEPRPLNVDSIALTMIRPRHCGHVRLEYCTV